MNVVRKFLSPAMYGVTAIVLSTRNGLDKLPEAATRCELPQKITLQVGSPLHSETRNYLLSPTHHKRLPTNSYTATPKPSNHTLATPQNHHRPSTSPLLLQDPPRRSSSPPPTTTMPSLPSLTSSDKPSTSDTSVDKESVTKNVASAMDDANVKSGNSSAAAETKAGVAQSASEVERAAGKLYEENIEEEYAKREGGA